MPPAFSAMPCGSFPTMITPFTSSGAIDFPVLERLIEWYISSGSVGLFSPCLSSEMYHLSEEELLSLSAFVYSKVAGRVPVVSSGTFGGSIPTQASFVRSISNTCDAVVVLTCQLAAEGESDEVWRRNCEELLSLTAGVPLGLYECPVPYKRLLSAEVMAWCARSGRFLFHKDTSCSLPDIERKIQAVTFEGSVFRFYNANVETLRASIELGGHGFSGISANFYPHLHARLCGGGSGDADADEKHKKAVQAFLTVAENVVVVNYPASAKEYIRILMGEGGGEVAMTAKCRANDFVFDEQKKIRLQELRNLERDISERIGVEAKAP